MLKYESIPPSYPVADPGFLVCGTDLTWRATLDATASQKIVCINLKKNRVSWQGRASGLGPHPHRPA